MKKLLLISLLIPLLWSCSDGGNNDPDAGNAQTGVADNSSGNTTPDVTPIDVTDLGMAANIADAFCLNQRKLRVMATSLLSAFSPKGNQPDANYCGGNAELMEDGLDFEIHVNDYCVEGHGQQVTVNGDIYGTVESGANFITSQIQDLTIVGTGVDMVVVGNTWDGRDDDMFVNLDITDAVLNNQMALEFVNIKKGEIDFGYFNFEGIGSVEFKFIKHFNDDNTEGQIFIYGEGEKLLILSGDNGAVTAVYKQDRHDPGTWVETTQCGL